MAVSDIDEDFKRMLKERKDNWNPIEKCLKDLEELLKEAELEETETHFKRLTHYLDKCKETDFEYNWNELQDSLQEPAKGFKVVGDQSVVDFLEQNPDYFEQAQEEAANESIPEEPKKKRKSCPARYKNDTQQKSEKQRQEKESVFLNEHGSLKKPHLVAVTKNRKGKRPKFFVNIDGDIRALRLDGSVSADGYFMAICSVRSQCNCRHRMRITNKDLFYKAEKRYDTIPEVRHFIREEDPRLFDRSSYEMLDYDSNTGVSMSPLTEHTCDKINVENVVSVLKKEGRLHTDEEEDPEIVFSNERGTASLPHLVAVVKSSMGKRPKFIVNIDGDIYSVRFNCILNADGSFVATCTRHRCKSTMKIQIIRKNLYEINDERRLSIFKTDVERLFDRSSYKIIAHDSRAHVCEKITPESVIEALKSEGRLPLDATVSNNMEEISFEENANSGYNSEQERMKSNGTMEFVVKDREEKEIILHNKRGTLNEPHLIAVVQSSKGKLPKFFINIEGSVRAMRYSSLNKSGAFMAVCCANYCNCPTRHKIQVMRKYLINKANPEKYCLTDRSKTLFDRSSYEMIAYDSITGVALNKLTDHICEELSLEDVVKALIKEGRLDKDATPSSLAEEYRKSVSSSKIEEENDVSEDSEEESMETDQVSEHEEEPRSRNTSREDDLVKEGVGEVNQPHLVAVGPGRVVQNRPIFYVNVCNKFYKMRHSNLNLKGECTLVCFNCRADRGKASCKAKSKLRILDDSLYAKDEGCSYPTFVGGAPNLFNTDSYSIEVYDNSEPHSCGGEKITYEEIRFMLSNVRIITPKKFQIESGDPNCKPSEELASFESGICMGCSRKFSDPYLLIEHILKYTRCSDTYVDTYGNFCFVCMESQKFLKTHYCDVNNGKIQTSAAIKELHIATWEIYNGEQWQSKLVNRVEILPSKLRRSVLGNSLNEDKIFDESAKGFTCYPVESGQCSSCNDHYDTWQGLFDHLEDNRYYLCREYYTYKGYCFICSKFYSKVSQHFNDVKRGKCSSIGTQTREIHVEFQERFIHKKTEFSLSTSNTSTPASKPNFSTVSCADGSLTVVNNRGHQLLIPEKCYDIESGQCSSCLEQFESWECLLDHLKETEECQNYYTQKYATYCFICSKPYKYLKNHLNDVLSGKVNCSADIRRIHQTMKLLYMPIPRPNRTAKNEKRSKKRVLQKTQSANSSDEDESFHVRKKCKNRSKTSGLVSSCASNMKEQVIEGDGTIIKPFLNAITIGLKQSPRYYVTVDGHLRILRWKSFSHQKETIRLTCSHKSCKNVCHMIEIKNKSLIECRGTPEAHINRSHPKIFDVNSYSMLSHETNDHKCTTSITLEEIHKIQSGELKLQQNIEDQPSMHENRTTPKHSYVKSTHSKNDLFESNDDNNEERISIDDSEDDSDGLDEESEPDSDDLMESTENSEMENSPIKPTRRNKHQDEFPSKEDDDMENEVQMAPKEPAEAIPEKEKIFQYSSASSDTDNDNPDNL